jgi:DNA-binding response OmpR family regulator
VSRGLILVVEDDPRLRELVRRELTAVGYDVAEAGTGGDGLARALEGGIDLVVLDLNLPDVDGLEVAERLRSDGDGVPLLMLTARGDLKSKVEGLYAGASDYLTKPFEVQELLARVHVRLRERETPDELRHGELVLQPSSATVRVGERVIVLPTRECEVLRLLLANRGRVFSKDDLERRLYGADGPSSNTVEVYVYQLRKRLQLLGIDDLIVTVRGKGYLVV